MDIETIKLALSAESFNEKTLKEVSKLPKEVKTRSYSHREKETLAILPDGRIIQIPNIPSDVRKETWFPMVIKYLLKEEGLKTREIVKCRFVRAESMDFQSLRKSKKES